MRVARIVLICIAIFLLVRAVQIYHETWMTAHARGTLLNYFVHRTAALTDEELQDNQFWSNFGEQDPTTFTLYLFAGLASIALCDSFGRWQRKPQLSAPGPSEAGSTVGKPPEH